MVVASRNDRKGVRWRFTARERLSARSSKPARARPLHALPKRCDSKRPGRANGPSPHTSHTWSAVNHFATIANGGEATNGAKATNGDKATNVEKSYSREKLRVQN